MSWLGKGTFGRHAPPSSLLVYVSLYFLYNKWRSPTRLSPVILIAEGYSTSPISGLRACWQEKFPRVIWFNWLAITQSLTLRNCGHFSPLALRTGSLDTELQPHEKSPDHGVRVWELSLHSCWSLCNDGMPKCSCRTQQPVHWGLWRTSGAMENKIKCTALLVKLCSEYLREWRL